ncbi:MAG: hypothetical protein D6716_04525 [Chloroflexi bacterium]|nr:MAG: hypothetical protein D6716_04525 [Chloroflexota bacterium]
MSARYARVATFGVRQPCCRSSRAHDPAHGTPLTLPVTDGFLKIGSRMTEIIASFRVRPTGTYCNGT